MKYEAIEPISKSEAENSLLSGDDALIRHTLIRLAHHVDDWRWAQSKCLHFAQHGNLNVRSTAILCLGHLARLHGKLDMDRVLPVLEECQQVESLRGRVDDVLDDIAIFVK